MNIKYIISVVTAVLESLFFSGLLFGWSSIVPVLRMEGYFNSSCAVDENQAQNVSTLNVIESFNISASELATTATTVNFTSDEIVEEIFTKSYETKSPSSGEPETSCDSQQTLFNLVFTIASSLLSFSTLINGYIYDKFGTWISRAISIVLFTMGGILMATSSFESSWVLFPAMTCFAIGGILMLVTNLQVGNLYGRYRSSVITLLSGALDSSSFVFLIFNILYNNGTSLKAIFLVVTCCTVLLWLRTFFLLPRRHIPFPVNKGYNFGISDCRSASIVKSKEMNIINENENNGIDNNEEKERLADEPDETEENDKVPAVGTFIKTSLFWGNVMHFSLLQLRNYFFLSSLYDWLIRLAKNADEAQSYLMVFGTCQLFGIVFAPLNGILIDTCVRFFKKKCNLAELVPLKALIASSTATTCIGLIFSIVIIIPSLPLQYASFILQVIFRSFLYGGSYSFIAMAFPGKHYGKLYGLTMFVAGCVSLLQFPLFTLVISVMGKNFFIMNVIFLFVTLATFLHPYNIHRCCRKKEKELDKLSD